ncbi:MAG TPA: hypothetical protein VEC19_02595 [Usitatibacter sp.]|nr:hypothetical protein [Usitatibacter sp.]
MTSLDQRQRELEQWRAVVGKAIVCFGELELVTHQCLVHLPSDKISDTSSKLPFSKRVDLIVEILEARASANDAVVTFVQMLRRAKKLAETRNDIAHNPVMMNIFVREESGDPLLAHCIATVRSGRVIDLAEATEFADEVEDLAASMWLQIGRLDKRAARELMPNYTLERTGEQCGRAVLATNGELGGAEVSPTAGRSAQR